MTILPGKVIRRPPTDAEQLPVKWRQGEHVSVVGDTGTGKTFLLSKLLPIRQHVVVFRTKPDDIKFPGFKTVNSVKAMDDPSYGDRLLLTPKYEEQGQVGYAMMEKAWKDGGWCVAIDELWYVERLGLKSALERLLTQGRSKHISVVCGMQRPAWVSRFALSQCTHLFSFRVERRDSKTLSDAFSSKIVPLVDQDSPRAITGHDFAYFHRGKRIVATGNAQNLGKVIQ